MSTLPTMLDGLGSAEQKPRPNPSFDPTACSLTSEDFYVFSRMDGTASFRDLILMIGRGAAYAVPILLKLRAAGAFLLDGETPDSLAEALRPTVAAVQHEADELTAEEQAALAEDVVLSEEVKRAVLVHMRAVVSGNPHRILGVDDGADLKTLKNAHRKLSKQFHPDRYYGKNTGSFGSKLAAIFEAATKAWEVLSNEAKRSRAGEGTQSRKEHAEELYQQGVQEQGQGNLERALMFFAGASRTHESPRYLRRAASCALEAGKLDQAEEFARRAIAAKPEDPSYLRVLADVLRAAGRPEEAREVLVQASEMRTENDALAAEIASDLEALRRRLRSP